VASKSRWRSVSRIQLGEALRHPAGQSGRFPGVWWERSGHESAPQAQRPEKSDSEPYGDPRARKCCCGRRNWSKYRARLARSRLRTWAPQPIGRTVPVRLNPTNCSVYSEDPIKSSCNRPTHRSPAGTQTRSEGSPGQYRKSFGFRDRLFTPVTRSRKPVGVRFLVRSIRGWHRAGTACGQRIPLDPAAYGTPETAIGVTPSRQCGRALWIIPGCRLGTVTTRSTGPRKSWDEPPFFDLAAVHPGVCRTKSHRGRRFHRSLSAFPIITDLRRA
jgi:hypothetical protein